MLGVTYHRFSFRFPGYRQAEEAEEETIRMLRIYEEFATQVAAIPVVAGRKSRLESFAGADCTYTIEAMMGDRRALQVRNSSAG